MPINYLYQKTNKPLNLETPKEVELSNLLELSNTMEEAYFPICQDLHA